MRAKKVDAHHAAIRQHLRSVGWRVFDTSAVGRGFPDLLVARRGFMALVEVKVGNARLNQLQKEFRLTWPGVNIQANSPEDAELQLDLAEKYQYLRERH